MTSYVTTTHHRRTSSLPRFDDGPAIDRNGDSFVFKVNVPHMSRSSQKTSKAMGDDDWSRQTVTTARSGDTVSGGTTRRTSERLYHQDTLPPPSSTSTPYHKHSSEYKFSTMQTTSSTSRPLQPFSSNHSHHDSSNFRSPFPRESGRSGHVTDFDDGGLANWEESFKKFNLRTTSAGKPQTNDDWKKDFLYHDGKQANHLTSGGGGGGPLTDLVYSRTTTTSTRGAGGHPRNVGSQRGCVSDSEDSWNWLEKQRAKLRTKRAMQDIGHEKLGLDGKLNQQRSEVEGRLLNELRSSQSTLPRHDQGFDLHRYRARSMDNVGVNPDEYEVVGYSKFGPNVQRKTLSSRFTESQRSSGGTLRSGPPSPDVSPAFGYGRRAYQTLPRDARLPGTMSRSPASSNAGDQKKNRTFRNNEKNLSTGSLNRRKSLDDRDEEIILRPIGPGIQPLESSVNPASTLSRIRHQQTTNPEMGRETSSKLPSFQLTPPTPGVSSTLTRSSTFHSFGSRPPVTSGNVPIRLRDDEVVVEQAISSSRDRSFEKSGLPSDGSHVDRFDQKVRRAQPVRTVVVSPERPPFPSNRPSFPQTFDSSATPGFSSTQTLQRQWISNGDRPSNVQSSSWQNHPPVKEDGSGRGVPWVVENQSVRSDQSHFTIQPMQDGTKAQDVNVGREQIKTIPIRQGLQTSHDQQLQQVLMQQQQQLEQQIFEQQKQLKQQQQQLLEQQQQLQKQLEQHRLLQQQLSRTVQQQEAPLQQPQQQFSYQKTEQLMQTHPRQITTDQQQFRGRQQEQRGQQLQLEEPTYDLLPQQRQPQQLHGQQQQQQQQQMQRLQQQVISQNFGQTLDNRSAMVDDRGSKSQNSVSIQTAQSSVTSFQGHGQAESFGGQPYYQSVPEALGESRITSPQYDSPFSVFQSGSKPLSPTGASSGTDHVFPTECKFEAVMPTYATPDKNRSFDSSGGSDVIARTTVRTFQKTSTPSKLSSVGTGTSGFDASPVHDRGYLVQEASHRSYAVPLSHSNRPLAVQTSSANGPTTPGGDGLISPESYWIQRSTAETPTRNESKVIGAQFYDTSERTSRKVIGGTSSIESSLTPLSVDVNRAKWTETQGQSSPSFQADRSSGGSLSSSRDGSSEQPNQMSNKYAKDTSHLWYKPQLSREEVIASLKNKAVGSFLVRDSNTYPGSYALAVRVAAVPNNAPSKKLNGDPSEELVRHFLIEPTPTGVRLKGYKAESVFGDLNALIYQHSITPLSLPCRLLLPVSADDGREHIFRSVETSPSGDQLVHCAFNVLFIMSAEIELLSGPEAVERTASAALEKASTLRTTVVSLKVLPNGVTITDNNRLLFFRQHFPAELIRYCGLDRRLRCWTYLNPLTGQITKNKIFGIISRRSGSRLENECHLFAELDSIPLSSGAILNSVNQIIPVRDRK